MDERKDKHNGKPEETNEKAESCQEQAEVESIARYRSAKRSRDMAEAEAILSRDPLALFMQSYIHGVCVSKKYHTEIELQAYTNGYFDASVHFDKWKDIAPTEMQTECMRSILGYMVFRIAQMSEGEIMSKLESDDKLFPAQRDEFDKLFDSVDDSILDDDFDDE
ncbi:MAG TPA: hypothetical protein P5116_07940 [Eubacteriales bacterium]|nr:hypothetical protein [Clostridia bacterium]HRV73788.1 hypothetical protein [Eubacteriales bacterium]